MFQSVITLHQEELPLSLKERKQQLPVNKDSIVTVTASLWQVVAPWAYHQPLATKRRQARADIVYRVRRRAFCINADIRLRRDSTSLPRDVSNPIVKGRIYVL